MFDISWGELILVGMVALIVIGPKELPTVLRTVGQWMTQIRRMASEFQGQFQEAMREAEFADLKKQVDSISDPIKGFSEYNPLETARKEMETAFEDKPAAPAADSVPAAADAPPAPPAEAISPAADVSAVPLTDEPAPTPPEPSPPAPAEDSAPPAPAETGGGRAA
jgi:sec-independent protein translocase protein TatB